MVNPFPLDYEQWQSLSSRDGPQRRIFYLNRLARMISDRFVFVCASYFLLIYLIVIFSALFAHGHAKAMLT